jgi:hypothetical protein
MASILDLFGVSSGDKQKDEAINQGLLHAGLTLMQSRGKLAPAIGQAGLSGLQAFQQHGQQEYVRKMQQAQLAEIERKRVQGDAEDKFRANLPSPLGQANQTAAQAGPLGTVAAAKAQPPVDPYQQLLHGAAQSGAIPIGSYLSTMAPKAPEYKTVGDSLVQIGANGVSEAYRAPEKAEKDPEAIRALKAIYGEGTPQYQAALQRYGDKMSTHAPAVNVSFGTPMPAVNPKTGEVELMRPDNKGGMNFTGIKPPPQDRDVKLPAELQRMQIAGDTMVSLLDRYEKLIRENNPRDPMTQANPAIRAEVQSVKRNMELQFKELQALGALAGPDIEIMRQALADPFSVQGAYYGKQGLLAQTKQARDLVKMRNDAILKSQGRTAKPAADAASAPADDPLGLRK